MCHHLCSRRWVGWLPRLSEYAESLGENEENPGIDVGWLDLWELRPEERRDLYRRWLLEFHYEEGLDRLEELGKQINRTADSCNPGAWQGDYLLVSCVCLAPLLLVLPRQSSATDSAAAASLLWEQVPL